ncbi:MAG: FxsA family protein [Campylobacteraceae bacterium]|nr:FxsA family protein [Campylobacteraceae bacterium]
MIYFILYIFLEVMISSNISSAIGGFSTFLEIIASAFIGFGLIANFRYTFFESLNALNNRTISIEEFQKLNAFSLLGAILLILPGFFSDILGLMLQFSFFATLFARKILHVGKHNSYENFNTKEKNDDVIDVEIIEHNTDK